MVPCDRNSTICGATAPRRRAPASKRRGKPAAAAIVLTLLLASCGGEATLVGPDASPAARTALATPSPLATPATPATPSVPTAAIGPVVWTTAVDPRTSAPGDTVTAYAPDARRIVAAAPLRGVPPESTIAASWFYNNTSLDAFATQLTTTGDDDQTWVSFYIERSGETPWPEGEYEIALSLDGQEVTRAEVSVVAPG